MGKGVPDGSQLDETDIWYVRKTDKIKKRKSCGLVVEGGSLSWKGWREIVGKKAAPVLKQEKVATARNRIPPMATRPASTWQTP